MTELPRDELIAHVRDHVGFLQASAAAFDTGLTAEAKRLAVSLRVLLHNTNQSHSLFHQLGWSDEAFAAAGEPIAANALFATGPLVSMGDRYFAHLEACTRWESFSDWWTETIYKTPQTSLSRKDYVLAASNKGGGAHVDPSLDNIYRDLTHNESLGWRSSFTVEDADGTILSSVDEATTFLNNPMPASLRTITHELLTTIASHHPEVMG